jgi:hypothetical protein
MPLILPNLTQQVILQLLMCQLSSVFHNIVLQEESSIRNFNSKGDPAFPACPEHRLKICAIQKLNPRFSIINKF